MIDDPHARGMLCSLPPRGRSSRLGAALGAHNDDHFVPQRLVARVLPGAAAHQRGRAHHDERPRRAIRWSTPRRSRRSARRPTCWARRCRRCRCRCGWRRSAGAAASWPAPSSTSSAAASQSSRCGMQSFVLYCFATAVIGVYNAIGLQYRFAAAEVASKADRARAISLVLAGGIVGGFAGPAITRYGKDMFASPFLGSFLLLAVVALAAACRAVARRGAEAVARGERRRRAAAARDPAPARVRRRRAGRDARLRPHESPDDRDAARDGLLRACVRAGRDGDFVARGGHVRAGLRDGFVDRPLRSAQRDPRRCRSHGARRHRRACRQCITGIFWPRSR